MTKKNTHAQRGKSLEERFWEKVEKTSDCWWWRSAIGSRGYGIRRLNTNNQGDQARKNLEAHIAKLGRLNGK